MNRLVKQDAETILAKKKLRSQVLTIATRTGIHDTNDWDKFNRFMIHNSVCKKTLNLYNLDELEKLVQQFRALERNYNKSANKVGTKAWAHKNHLPNVSNN